MPTYRKIPVSVEVECWNGSATEAARILEWMGRHGGTGRYMERPGPARPEDVALMIDTLEGTHRADPGDWIIKGVHNEFYPCKPDIFAKTHEEEL